MRIIVALEHRFVRTPDGRVWSQTMFAYPFWQRYLDVFDSVRVVARVRDVERVPASYLQANGEGVEVAAVTHYLGPTDYVRKRARVRRDVEQAVSSGGAVILRVPGRLGTIAADLLMQTGRPFGVEVVGDPYDVFAPGAIKHPLRPYFRWKMPRDLRRICTSASVVAYVSNHGLPSRYPVSDGVFTTSYSSIQLSNEAFACASKCFSSPWQRVRLVAVGSLQQMYKGPDVVLRSMAKMFGSGLEVELVWIGDGRHKAELQALAVKLGLSHCVKFVGQLPAGEAVRRQLDSADIFVLASRTEGLPRAMIEAMARGLPCIGSTVGGIPELIPPEDMVPPGDVDALAAKIAEVAKDPERMTAMSARNLAKAREYRDDVLKARRNEMYARLRDVTEAYFASR